MFFGPQFVVFCEDLAESSWPLTDIELPLAYEQEQEFPACSDQAVTLRRRWLRHSVVARRPAFELIGLPLRHRARLS